MTKLHNFYTDFIKILESINWLGGEIKQGKNTVSKNINSDTPHSALDFVGNRDLFFDPYDYNSSTNFPNYSADEIIDLYHEVVKKMCEPQEGLLLFYNTGDTYADFNAQKNMIDLFTRRSDEKTRIVDVLKKMVLPQVKLPLVDIYLSEFMKAPNATDPRYNFLYFIRRFPIVNYLFLDHIKKTSPKNIIKLINEHGLERSSPPSVQSLIPISNTVSNVKSLTDQSDDLGKPEDSRKTPGNQYFFVNNRFFRSGYFLKAIQKAYENLSAEGTIPTFFIYFETDPHKIDVNIHPAKTEVKFEDDSLIFEILQSAVKEAIGKKVLSPSIDFDLGGLLDVPTVKKGEYIPPPKIDYDPLFNPFNENYDFDRKPVTHIEYKSKIDGENYHNILFRDSGLSQKPILQLSKKYIVTTIKSGLLVIDIKRAQERILYERYLTYINNHNSIVQQNLFPKTAQLSEHSYSFLSESADKIARLGFKITFNGNDRNKPAGESREITIEGLPSGFTDDIDMLPEIIDKLISDLSEIGDLFDENLREQISATLATAATSGRPVNLNTLEAQLLIDSLYACKDPSISPSGKSCMQIIPVTELDSRFN
jgi:hypothetical protein